MQVCVFERCTTSARIPVLESRDSIFGAACYWFQGVLEDARQVRAPYWLIYCVRNIRRLRTALTLSHGDRIIRVRLQTVRLNVGTAWLPVRRRFRRCRATFEHRTDVNRIVTRSQVGASIGAFDSQSLF